MLCYIFALSHNPSTVRKKVIPFYSYHSKLTEIVTSYSYHSRLIGNVSTSLKKNVFQLPEQDHPPPPRPLLPSMGDRYNEYYIVYLP